MIVENGIMSFKIEFFNIKRFSFSPEDQNRFYYKYNEFVFSHLYSKKALNQKKSVLIIQTFIEIEK